MIHGLVKGVILLAPGHSDLLVHVQLPKQLLLGLDEILEGENEDKGDWRVTSEIKTGCPLQLK